MPLALITLVTHCVGHKFPVSFQICMCHIVQKEGAAISRVETLKF